MTYVRSKQVPGNDKTYTYYQVVRGFRVDGKVKQEVVAHLGRHETPEAALTYWDEAAGRWRQRAGDHLHAAEYIRQGRARSPHYGAMRRKRLVPRKKVTPLESEAPPSGGFAPTGWFYSSGTAEEVEAEAAEYIVKAEALEERAARLRAVL
jgi:hypothetical protein